MTHTVTKSLVEHELDSGSDFVVAEWSVPPSATGEPEPMAPVHIHLGDDEAWYVLEGSLGFVFDGVRTVVEAGGAAIAKAGVAHTYWNAGATDTRYLIILTPSIREMIAVLHDPGRRQGRTIDEVFAAYNTVVSPDQSLGGGR